MSKERYNLPSMDYEEFRRKHELYKKNHSVIEQSEAKKSEPLEREAVSESENAPIEELPKTAKKTAEQNAQPIAEPIQTEPPMSEEATEAPVGRGTKPEEATEAPVERGAKPEAQAQETTEEYPEEDEAEDHSDDEYVDDEDDTESDGDSEEDMKNPNPFQPFLEVFKEVRGFVQKKVAVKFAKKKNTEEFAEDESLTEESTEALPQDADSKNAETADVETDAGETAKIIDATDAEVIDRVKADAEVSEDAEAIDMPEAIDTVEIADTVKTIDAAEIAETIDPEEDDGSKKNMFSGVMGMAKGMLGKLHRQEESEEESESIEDGGESEEEDEKPRGIKGLFRRKQEESEEEAEFIEDGGESEEEDEKPRGIKGLFRRKQEESENAEVSEEQAYVPRGALSFLNADSDDEDDEENTDKDVSGDEAETESESAFSRFMSLFIKRVDVDETNRCDGRKSDSGSEYEGGNTMDNKETVSASLAEEIARDLAENGTMSRRERRARKEAEEAEKAAVQVKTEEAQTTEESISTDKTVADEPTILYKRGQLNTNSADMLEEAEEPVQEALFGEEEKSEDNPIGKQFEDDDEDEKPVKKGGLFGKKASKSDDDEDDEDDDEDEKPVKKGGLFGKKASKSDDDDDDEDDDDDDEPVKKGGLFGKKELEFDDDDDDDDSPSFGHYLLGFLKGLAAVVVVLLIAVGILNVLDYNNMGPVESMRSNIRDVAPEVFDTLFPSSAMKHAADILDEDMLNMTSTQGDNIG